MSTKRWETKEAWVPAPKARRFRFGRRPIVPGPLQRAPRRRRGSSLAISFTMFSAAVIAAAIVVAIVSDRSAAKSTSSVAERAVGAGVGTLVASTKPFRVTTSPVAASEPAPSARASAPGAPALSRNERPAPPDREPAAEPSPFRLEALPTLEASAAGFDLEQEAPAARQVARANRRPGSAAAR